VAARAVQSRVGVGKKWNNLRPKINLAVEINRKTEKKKNAGNEHSPLATNSGRRAKKTRWVMHFSLREFKKIHHPTPKHRHFLWQWDRRWFFSNTTLRSNDKDIK
jgi:hypothetical protein